MIDERIPDGMTVIEETWSIDDVYMAHDILDAYDEARIRAEGKTK